MKSNLKKNDWIRHKSGNWIYKVLDTNYLRIRKSNYGGPIYGQGISVWDPNKNISGYLPNSVIDEFEVIDDLFFDYQDLEIE